MPNAGNCTAHCATIGTPTLHRPYCQGIMEHPCTISIPADFPGYICFQGKEDKFRSTDQRFTEFELEKLVRNIDMLASEERHTLLHQDRPGGFLPPPVDNIDASAHRQKRMGALRMVNAIPRPEKLLTQAEIMAREVSLTLEPRNTLHHTLAVLARFYSDHAASNDLARRQLLIRWSRYCTDARTISYLEPDLHARLAHVSRCTASANNTLRRIQLYQKWLADQAHKQQAQNQMQSLEELSVWSKVKKSGASASPPAKLLGEYGNKPELVPQDVHVLLRAETHQRQRYSLFEEAVRPSLSDMATDPASTVPLTPTLEAEIQEQVHDLMVPFHLSHTTGLRELLFSLNKHFDTVFTTQVGNMSCVPYQLSPTPRESDSSEQMMYKESTWKSASVPTPRKNEMLETQQAKLSSVVDSPDAVICSLLSFLAETKLAPVKKRLKELSESHADRTPVSLIQRTYMQQRVNHDDSNSSNSGLPSASVPELKPGEQHQGLPQEAGGKATTANSNMQMLRQAVFLLRYLRTREFRQRITSALNLLQSVERLLTFDAHEDLHATPLDMETLSATSATIVEGFEVMPRVVPTTFSTADPSPDEVPMAPAVASTSSICGFSGGRWWDLMSRFRHNRGRIMSDLLTQNGVQMRSAHPLQRQTVRLDTATRSNAPSSAATGSEKDPDLKQPNSTNSVPVQMLTFFADPFQSFMDLSHQKIQANGLPIPADDNPGHSMLHAMGAHIDSFSMNEDKEINVLDVLGNRVLYSSTLREMQRLEEELAVIASHYVQQYNQRNGAKMKTDIDRFAILEDLYECEAWFQHSKVRVIMQLLEAYLHSTDKAAHSELRQGLTDLVHARPLLNLTAEYFVSSYSDEIVTLELRQALLQQIGMHQVKQERQFSAQLSQQGFSLAADGSEAAEGYPLPQSPDGPVATALFPFTTSICPLNIMSSLELLGDVELAIGASVQSLQHAFNLDSVPVVQGLRQGLLQQALVEWRVLIDETALQAEMLPLTDLLPIDSPDILASVVDEVLKKAPQSLKLSHWSKYKKDNQLKANAGDTTVSFTPAQEGNLEFPEESSDTDIRPQSEALPDAHITVGGFDTRDQNGLLMQAYSNVIELGIIRDKLTAELFQTEILQNIHRLQGKLMGINVKRLNLDSLNFEVPQHTVEEVDECIEKLAEIDVAEEVLSVKTQRLSGLAIGEFDSAVASYDMHNPAEIQHMIICQLPILRRALQVQSHLLASYGGNSDTTFVTAQANLDHSKQSVPDHMRAVLPVDRATLQASFVSVNAIKGAGHPGIQELKMTLLGDYCKQIIAVAMGLALKSQINDVSQALRHDLAAIPFAQPYVSIFMHGQPGDKIRHAARHLDRFKRDDRTGTCLVAADGRVEEIFYLPHPLHVHCLYMDSEMPTSWDDVTRFTHRHKYGDLRQEANNVLTTMYHILTNHYTILQFVKSTSQLVVSQNQALVATKAFGQVPKLMYEMQQDLLQSLFDLSDPKEVVTHLENQVRLRHLTLVVALHAAKSQLQTCPSDSMPKPEPMVTQPASNSWSYRGGAGNRHNTQTTMVGAAPVLADLSGAVNYFLPLGIIEQALSMFADGVEDACVLDEDLMLQAQDLAQTLLLPAQDSGPQKSYKKLLAPPQTPNTAENPPSAESPPPDENMPTELPSQVSSLVHDTHDPHMLRSNSGSSMKQWMDTLAVLYSREILFQEWGNVLHSTLLHQINGALWPYISEKYRHTIMLPIKRQLEVEGVMDEEDQNGYGSLSHSAGTNSADQEYRWRQCVVLHQQLDIVLLGIAISSLKANLHHVTQALACATGDVPAVTEQTASLSKRLHVHQLVADQKAALFDTFVHSITSKVLTEREGDDLYFRVPEAKLGMALDALGQQLHQWQDNSLKQVLFTQEALLLQMRAATFHAERRSEYLQTMLDFANKSVDRRVQAKMTDDQYNLIFYIESLEHLFRQREGELADLRKIVAQEVRRECQSEMDDLRHKNEVLEGKFVDYKAQLYRHIQANLETTKMQAMQKIRDSNAVDKETKHADARSIVTDSELTKLKDENAELKETISKLRLWLKIRQRMMQAEYEAEFQRMKSEGEQKSADFWNNREVAEEKEDMMRNQLLFTQNALSAAEIEVEKLAKDVATQMRSKKELVAWKAAYGKKLEELQSKAKKYEKWGQYDVSTLVMELGKAKKEILKLQQIEQEQAKLKSFHNKREQKEIQILKNRVSHEHRLKMKAFERLDTLRLSGGPPGGDDQWKDAYSALADRCSHFEQLCE
eukprot:gene2264-71_t